MSECLYRVGSEEDNEACRRSQLSLHRQIGNRGPFSGTFVTITMSFTSDDSLSSAVIFFVFLEKLLLWFLWKAVPVGSLQRDSHPDRT